MSDDSRRPAYWALWGLYGGLICTALALWVGVRYGYVDRTSITAILMTYYMIRQLIEYIRQ